MEWLSDELAAATANAHVEGADYTFARRDPRVRTGNYTQVFVTPVEVSDTQRAVETAGLEDEYAYQMAKALKEHARDIEYAFASTANTGNSGASGTARQLKGVMAWITTTNITGTGSGDETLTETMFNDALQAIWNEGGRPDAVYANGFQKRKISGFTASSTKFVEASEKEVVAGVDVLTKNIAHLKLGHMLENPKALNAKGSCETTLIMVKSGRKFKRCNNGQSAGKITWLVGRDNRWRGNNQYPNVLFARPSDKTCSFCGDSQFPLTDIGKMFGYYAEDYKNQGRASSETFEKEVAKPMLANKNRWLQIYQKPFGTNSSLFVYQKREGKDSFGIYLFEGKTISQKGQIRKNRKTILFPKRSRVSFENKSKAKEPSKILRDYTPSSQCGDDIVRPLMRVREVGRNVQPYFSNKSDDSDFGRVKIVADRYMNAAQVAILQSDLWKTAVLRPTKHIEVAKVGSATRGVIETELTLESRNEAGSGKITQLATS